MEKKKVTKSKKKLGIMDLKAASVTKTKQHTHTPLLPPVRPTRPSRSSSRSGNVVPSTLLPRTSRNMNHFPISYFRYKWQCLQRVAREALPAPLSWPALFFCVHCWQWWSNVQRQICESCNPFWLVGSWKKLPCVHLSAFFSLMENVNGIARLRLTRQSSYRTK